MRENVTFGSEPKARFSDFDEVVFKTIDNKTSEVISQQLVEAMCLGEHEAFRKIYLHCYDRLKEFLTILLHNQEDAEEVVQDIFLYILENKEKIDSKKNFKGYLYTIAKTKAFDCLKRRKLDLKYSDYRMNSMAEVEPAPDHAVMAEEQALIIAMYIDSMPPQRKRVFELSRMEGKTINEIAEIMELSPQTVKNYLCTATGGLRELVTLFTMLFVS